MPTLNGHVPRRVPFSRDAVRAFAATDARRDAAARLPHGLPSKQYVPGAGACQITHLYPGGAIGEGTSLLDVLQQARKARGNRKALRAPSRPTKSGHAPLFRRMGFHLRRLSRRALNDLAKQGISPPDVTQLKDALTEYVWAEHSGLVFFQEAGEPPLARQGPRWLNGDGAVDRVAWSAARYSLDRWTADYIRAQQDRGARGGRASSRGPSKATDENLARLRELVGATAEEQAAAMGCSVRTVYRLRALDKRLTASVEGWSNNDY